MSSTRFTISGDPNCPTIGFNGDAADDLAGFAAIARRNLAIDTDTARRLGAAMAVLAYCHLSRIYQRPSRSDVMRLLDQYYFAFPETSLHSAFDDGADAALEVFRSGSISSADEVARQVVLG